MSSTPDRVRAVKPTSLVDSVTEELRHSILDGSLPPGEGLSIRALSNELGTSHIPVREAFRRLTSEGLIEWRPNVGPIVSDVSEEDLRDIYRLRRMIESDLARRSAKLFTDEDLVELQSLADNMLVRVESGRLMAEGHIAFHRKLVSPAASTWDLRVLDLLWRASERYNQMILAAFEERHAVSEITNAHQPLLAAARARAPEDLRRAVMAHLDEALERFRSFAMQLEAAP